MASLLDLSKERDAHIEQRLRTDHVIWLVTVRPDGRPHAVAVWFLWDSDTILIFSKPNNQKIRNLQANPNVLLPWTIPTKAQTLLLLKVPLPCLQAASWIQLMVPISRNMVKASNRSALPPNRWPPNIARRSVFDPHVSCNINQ